MKKVLPIFFVLFILYLPQCFAFENSSPIESSTTQAIIKIIGNIEQEYSSPKIQMIKELLRSLNLASKTRPELEAQYHTMRQDLQTLLVCQQELLRMQLIYYWIDFISRNGPSNEAFSEFTQGIQPYGYQIANTESLEQLLAKKLSDSNAALNSVLSDWAQLVNQESGDFTLFTNATNQAIMQQLSQETTL